MSHKIRIILLMSLLGFISCMTSCHSRRHTVRGHNAEVVADKRPDKHHPTAKPSGTARKIIEEGRRWIGTPYLYGGQTKKGMDCSGFVQTVFNNTTDIKLPRSSRDMAKFARRISREQLRPADLVFFVSSQGGDRINHVALYIGDGRILHATTSKGVIESDLNEGYWKKHYYCSGRVLN
ncbi:MAG: C40 family peptidase [Muribaculaceae bacterium]|nr:C40 family peptidase [Muribaculaceae bacterium]